MRREARRSGPLEGVVAYDDSIIQPGEDTYEPDETKSLDRFAVVEVRGLLALPRWTRGDFSIAFALGDWRGPSGRRRLLHSGQVAEASVITKGRKDHVLYVLGKGASTWWRWVQVWRECWMAHRCEPGRVALFRRPSVVCPVCDSLLPDSHRVRVKPPRGESPPPRGETVDSHPMRDSEHETATAKRLLLRTEKRTAQVGEEETPSPSESSSSSSSSRVSLPVSVSQNGFAKSAAAPQKREGLTERANRESPARPWSKDRSAASMAEAVAMLREAFPGSEVVP